MKKITIVVGCIMFSYVHSINFTKYEATELGIDASLGNACFMDINNDGWIDIFAGTGYINNKDNTFTKLESCRCDVRGRIAQADINGDEYPDILAIHRIERGKETVRLFLNQGPPDFSFLEISEEAGLVYTMSNRDLVDIGWFDADNDGDLDFYVTSYEYPVNSAVGHEDYLFFNKGDNTFEDVSEEKGIETLALCSRGLSFSDYDLDGDVDIFVSVYRLQPNILWENHSGDSFIDVAGDKGVKGIYSGGYYGHNIGAAWGDVDNDGDMDIFTPITHHSGYPGDYTNHLWVNMGPPEWVFEDRITDSGLRNVEIGSSPSWVDFDNDGDLDLYYVNLYGAPAPGGWLFRNDGNYKFTDVTTDVGLIDYHRKNWAIWVDINNDGFMDGLIPRYTGSEWIYEFFINSADNGNHYIEVDLRSKDSLNRYGIGTKLYVYTDTLIVYREVLHNAGHGYGSPFFPRQHFGLGKHELIDSLVIIWNSGLREVYHDLPVDTIYKFIEGESGIGTSGGEERREQRIYILKSIEQLNIEKFLIYDINGRVVEKDAGPGVYFLVEDDRITKIIVTE